MRTLRTTTFVLATLMALPGVAVAQDANPEERIARLVERLSDPDFQVRDAATEELVQIGEAALPALEKAAASDDAEVSWRAKKTLETIKAKLAESKPAPEPEGPTSRGPDGMPDMQDLFGNGFLDEEEMRKLMEEAFQNGQGGTYYFRNFAFEENGNGTSRREVGIGDTKYVFETTEDGGVKGTVETTEDGKKTVRDFSYGSEEAFKSSDPDLYAVYEKHAAKGDGFAFKEGPFQFQFRMEGFEQMEEQMKQMRERFERAFGGAPRGTDPQPDAGEVPDRIKKSIEEALEDARRRARGEDPLPRSTGTTHAGLSGSTVEAALRAQLDVAEDEGLLVESIEAGSAAESWGFQKHDLVLTVDGQPVDTVADFRRAVESLDEGETAVARIVRRGQRTEVRIEK